MQYSSDFYVISKSVILKYGNFEMIFIGIYLAYICLFQEPLRYISLITIYTQNIFAITYN